MSGRDTLERFRIRVAAVILVAYLGFALGNAIKPTIVIPTGLSLAVGAVVTWLFTMPFASSRRRRRREEDE